MVTSEVGYLAEFTPAGELRPPLKHVNLALNAEPSVIFLFDPKPGEVRTWTHCEIEGLCFIVTIMCTHTGQLNRAAVVSCAYELRHYLQVAKDVQIKHVQMMCPPSISGRPQWVLEELESVEFHTGVDTEEGAVTYRTRNSVYKLGRLDLRKRKISRTLFSSSHLRTRQTDISEAKKAAASTDLYAMLWTS